MNRRDRRQAARRGLIPTGAHLAYGADNTRKMIDQLARCPDCLSEAIVWRDPETGFVHVDVGHDDTCPTWRAIQRQHHDDTEGTADE